MGVAAGVPKTDTLAPARRARGRRAGGRRTPRWREDSARAARQYPLPWADAKHMLAPQGKNMRETLWERLQDDRDLVRLKTTLLLSLVILTAVLEWVS